MPSDQGILCDSASPPTIAVRLVFEHQGREGYTSRLKTGRKMLARINKLIE